MRLFPGIVFVAFFSLACSAAPDAGRDAAAEAPEACSSASCRGCCGQEGTCQAGSTADACGVAGAACSVCGVGASCRAGQCEGQAKLVMFGGFDRMLTRDDTWTFDGTTWTQVSSAEVPAARHSYAIAALGNQAVMFGGHDYQTAQPLNDTWIFDAAGWHRANPVSSPPVRRQHAMAAQ